MNTRGLLPLPLAMRRCVARVATASRPRAPSVRAVLVADFDAAAAVFRGVAWALAEVALHAVAGAAQQALRAVRAHDVRARVGLAAVELAGRAARAGHPAVDTLLAIDLAV